MRATIGTRFPDYAPENFGEFRQLIEALGPQFAKRYKTGISRAHAVDFNSVV